MALGDSALGGADATAILPAVAPPAVAIVTSTGDTAVTSAAVFDRATSQLTLPTSMIAAAARQPVDRQSGVRRIATGSCPAIGAASAGRTPPGTESSASRMRVEPAISPRASITAARQSAHSARCASIARPSSALSAPSSQA